MDNPEFQKIIDHLKGEFTAIRSGRAHPALIERVEVEGYGSRLKLIELASIALADARTLVVDAWDKTILKEIERALTLDTKGLTVVNNGTVIRVIVPPLTEESRQEMVKMVHTKLEHARVNLRKLRDRMREEVVRQEKAKAISEDEKYRRFEELDKETKKITEELEGLARKKEEELTR